jgi:hypothetical protein
MEAKRKRLWHAGFAALVCALALLGAFVLPGMRAEKVRAPSERRTVLVELFTSEGCSSCPPADELLKRLDRTQPVECAQIIALSEHVDYWDGPEWRDPFSWRAYSDRQDAYASRFRLNTVYTPQMVVDGRFETVGSDQRRALEEIDNAARSEKTNVRLSGVSIVSKNSVGAHIEVAPIASPNLAGHADVLVALADESDESHVHGGENGGRTLSHVAVLRDLTRVGTVDAGKSFAKNVRIDLTAAPTRQMRMVVIVQVPTGRVWELPPSASNFPNLGSQRTPFNPDGFREASWAK